MVNTEISMDVVAQALKNRRNDSLRERILQSLGYDISSEENPNELKDLDTKVSSNIIDDVNYHDLDTLSDYEKLNFIPNDDNPDDLVKNYDVVIRKLDDYDVIVYFLLKYPKISSALLQRTIEVINKKDVILSDAFDEKFQCYVLIKKSSLILSLISYIAATFVVENFDKMYDENIIDYGIVDNLFNITEDNTLSMKLTSAILQVVNNPDLIKLNRAQLTRILDFIKNQKTKIVLAELLYINNYSSLLKFSLFAQGYDEDDFTLFKLNIISAIEQLLKARNKE